MKSWHSKIRFLASVSPRFVLSLIVVVLASCARTPQRPVEAPALDPQVLFSAAAQNAAGLRDFIGNGVIEVSGPDVEKTAFGLTIKFLRPDFLNATLKGPMGIRLGQLTLAGDQYEIRSAMDPWPSQGRVDDLDLKTTLGVSLTHADLLRIFLPLIEFSSLPDSINWIATQERDCQLSWPEGDGLIRAWRRLDKPVFTRILVASSKGDTLWYKAAQRISRTQGLFVPAAWELQVGQGQQAYRMELDLRDLDANNGLIPDDFHIQQSNYSDSVEGHLE